MKRKSEFLNDEEPQQKKQLYQQEQIIKRSEKQLLLITSSDEEEFENNQKLTDQYQQQQTQKSIENEKDLMDKQNQIEIQNKLRLAKVLEECQQIIKNQSYINEITNEVALDCEMIRCQLYPNKQIQSICRISIVNKYGFVLFDSLIKPTLQIVNYLTPITGIRHGDLNDKPTLQQVLPKLKELLNAKIIIGHSVFIDLQALGLNYLLNTCIDIVNQKIQAKMPKYLSVKYNQTSSLKWLTNKHLLLRIQDGYHSSIQDAKASMALYLYHLQTF